MEIEYPDRIPLEKFKYLLQSISKPANAVIQKYPYITKERILRGDVCFRAHRVYLTCPLQEYIAYKTNSDIEILIEPERYIAYEAGRLLHPFLREFFSEGALHGYKKCMACDYVSREIQAYYPLEKCPKCGALLQYEEISLKFNNLGGSLDGLYRNSDSNNYLIIDFKSASDKAFKKYSESIDNVSRQYIYQMNAYMFLMRQNNLPVEDFAYLLYFNKETGEILRVKVPYNDVIVYDIIKTIEITKYHIMEDKEPPGFLKCNNPECKLHVL